MNRLHRYLPPYERNSEVFKEITRVQSDEFDKLDVDIEDLSKQFAIDTATWGLATYEKELGITIIPNRGFEERRAIIKSKWRGVGKVDVEMIRSIVEAYTRSEVSIAFDGRIKIEFSNKETIALNIGDMHRSIEVIKLAHLGYDIAMVLKQKESEVFIASVLVAGEEITVYPYSPKDIESKGKFNIAIGSNTGLENIAVYPRKEVN